MKYFFVAIVAVVFPAFISAQTRCAQHILEDQFRQASPANAAFIESYNAEILAQQFSSGDRAEKKVISVVFHVIHDNGPENISDEQIYDAVRNMNLDYSASNSELSTIVAAFTNIIGTGDIEFRLAKVDPSGNSTSGIDRVVSDETYIGDDGSKLNVWPRSKYLNIWVTDVISISNAAAYAYRPPNADASPSVDGVIANHRYVGSIGTASQSGSKTLTHEVGHFLNLPHTWGETNEPGLASNCQIDDGIFDTPNCIGVSNGGCPLTQVSCGSLDNIQNFMDYASCDAMFTAGQVNVMRATLASSVAQRSSLVSTTTLGSTGVTTLSAAKFYLPKRVVCRGEAMELRDESTYDPEIWTWTLTGPVTLTSTEQHPSFTFTTPGTYTVELVVKKGSVTKSVKEINALSVGDYVGQAVPFTENFSGGQGNWITFNHEEPSQTYSWKHSPTIGKGDSYSFKMANLGQEPNRFDDLVFNNLDLRPLSAVSITFDVAYAQIIASNADKLQFELSNDCGETWRSVWSATGATLAGGNALSTTAFEPSAGNWTTFSVSSIPLAWVGASTAVRFRFTSGGGNHLYLDNINIVGTWNAIPVLVYPANNASSMNSDVVVDWRAVYGASEYAYEVDTDPSFASASKQSGTLSYTDESSENSDTRFAPTGLTHGSTYYWHVRAKTNGVYSSWSESWKFAVATDGVGIARPIETLAFRLYPNPASESVTVSWSMNQPLVSIQLYSMSGQRINTTLQMESEHALMSVSDIPGGHYYVCLTTEGGSFFQSLVITD